MASGSGLVGNIFPDIQQAGPLTSSENTWALADSHRCKVHLEVGFPRDLSAVPEITMVGSFRSTCCLNPHFSS